jgi:hypothetical protein
MHPVKAKVIPLSDYPINFKMSKLPSKKKEFEISCFDLDKFRKENALKSMNNKVELE